MSDAADDKDPVYTGSIKRVFNWKDRQKEAGVRFNHYPESSMLAPGGSPRLLVLGKSGGRGVRDGGYEAWVYFDRAYVVHWLAHVFLARMDGVPGAMIRELFESALREIGEDENAKL